MPTTFSDATDAILGEFRDAWAISHATDCPIAWPSVAFDPKTDFDPEDHVAWVRVSIQGGEAQQASLAAPPNRLFRVVGVILVQVFVPSGPGLGLSTALGVADDVVSALEGKNAGGVAIRAGSINPVGRDGEWEQVNVSFAFRFDRDA
ncbi:MAG: hypothetical protein FJY95_22490 [Candidatus Handelsmanbacteria bacterium]|nr:hypothetical protein [Candidatus Handelsmanbacteria bacterium]